MLTFAIGDIHGCLGHLDFILRRIAEHAGSEPHRIVCLGDYVDRGPDSAGVIARLRDLEARQEVVCLKGNHEDQMLRAASDFARDGGWWFDLGGEATLASYGVRHVAELPADAIAWIAARPTFFDDGRRYFVHAGVDPRRALALQRDEDRIWIREPFLQGDHDVGRFVVHGHTPRLDGRPDIRLHRVNLDTGAVYGGRLTAAIFVDAQEGPLAFLQTPSLAI